MKPFKTILSVALALLVLISSSSFMIGIHICSGEIQHVGIFTKAQVCEKEQNLPPCHRALRNSCCEDESIVHPGDDIKPAVSHIQIAPEAMDIADLRVLISEVIPATPFLRAGFVPYDPPLRWGDITLTNQVLLI